MELSTTENFRKKFNVDLDRFPFFYCDAYAIALKKHEEKNTMLINCQDGNSMVCKTWRNKFIVIIQPMYPPLNKEGLRLDKKEEKRFLNEFVKYIKEKKLAQRITQPENFAIFAQTPERSTRAPFGTYILNIEEQTEEELFKGLHSKNRNVIRNAEKNNVQIKYGKEVIKDFFSLYLQTMQRSNMYYHELSYFENFYDDMPGNIICGVAYHNEIPLGGLFIPFTRFGAFYLYGASAESKEINGAINYLHWNTIKLLKKKGVKRYDFVGARLSDVSGTKLEGIQQFKERFGAKLEKGFLWKMNVNKFDCFVFDFLVYTKHKLNGLTPPIDIIDEEIEKNYIQLNKKSYRTLNKKIKNKISNERTQLSKLVRTFKRAIDKKRLVKDLLKAGIIKGDTILVHSSLSKIGNVQEGSKTVIEALLEQVGSEGNVIMPAYSYVDSMENTAKIPDYIFNPASSPSIVGKITEEFRKFPGVKRSLHPTHSVCAYGPGADMITEGHFSAGTNFGRNTPFHKIRELKGKIVGLGINIGPVTIYHSIEDFFPELFRGVYLPEPAPLKVLVNGKEKIRMVFIHNPSFHADRIDKNEKIEDWLSNHFREKGILHESEFGNGQIWWMDIQQLFDELIALRKKKISIYTVPAE
ncbi:MAG TPA: peptidoglycan bridge formation glycyltransferase FemA/FemB family protein [Bacteroidia bacterium]|nr:peptidoglycan bridge formation glycyltransferase FemA/FemB family protein [Bacteroidia bacterium]